MPDLRPELLHPDVRGNSFLSAAQLDAIALARARHLEDTAILIGDGTGVGKGAELAGTMLNHLKFNPNCKQYILVSANDQLETDFRRDLKSIGWPLQSLPLRSIEKGTSSNNSVPLSRGILFITYSLLRVEKSQKKRSRIDQVIEWASKLNGADGFDGVIAFDEIHAAKDPTTNTSKVVKKLQLDLPKARVVYASATSMSSVDHLSALVRLGLWGPGTPYSDYKAFHKKWKSQTRSGLEVVTAELAGQGKYVQRRLSFEGTTFSTIIAEFTPEQDALHRSLCDWWTALARLPNVLEGGQNRGLLWGAHLRFFKALLIAFRVPKALELAREHIESGGACVFSLIGTGEAASSRALADGDDIPDGGFVALLSTMRDILGKAEESVVSPALPPPELTSLKLLLDSFELPPSPLDMLVDGLSSIGQGCVELTGRSGGWYREKSTNRWVHKPRTMSNERGCALFQSAKADCAVISAAASTGISLHNDKKHKDRPRKQFMLELPWAADQSMQTLGRTHRSDQHSAPGYALITSNLNAEKRFASTVAKRAADLGAATSADRRGAHADNAFGSDYLISEGKEGMRKTFDALRMLDWPAWVEQSGSWSSSTSTMGKAFASLGINHESEARQLLGRLLGVPMHESNMCMHLFESACVEAAMQAAKSQSDVGVEDVLIDDNSKTKIVHTSPAGIITIAQDIGVSFEDAQKRLSDWIADGFGGGWASRYDSRSSRLFTLMARIEGPRVKCVRPNGRETLYFRDDFRRMYTTVVDEAVAKKQWDAEFTLCLNQCGHGTGCREPNCDFGKREVHSTIIMMPGALNVMNEYLGQRSIIRFNDAKHYKKCTAVRLGPQARHSDFELKLLEQKDRDDARLRLANLAEAEALALLDSQADASPDGSDASSGDSSDNSDSSDVDSDDESDEGEVDRRVPIKLSCSMNKRSCSQRDAARKAQKLAGAAARSILDSDPDTDDDDDDESASEEAEEGLTFKDAGEEEDSHVPDESLVAPPPKRRVVPLGGKAKIPVSAPARKLPEPPASSGAAVSTSPTGGSTSSDTTTVHHLLSSMVRSPKKRAIVNIFGDSDDDE